MGFGKGLHNALAEVHQSNARSEVVDESKVPELVRGHLPLRYADEETRARMEDLAGTILTDYLGDDAAVLTRFSSRTETSPSTLIVASPSRTGGPDPSR